MRNVGPTVETSPRRLIQGGSVQLNGEKLSDPKTTPEWKEGDVLKLDKKRQVRLSL